MAFSFSSVFPFLLPTHSVDCAVHLLLIHSRALLVSSALFHPFSALKCPFDGPFTTLKCPFDGPFTALKCPFQMAPCPSENLGRTLDCRIYHILWVHLAWEVSRPTSAVSRLAGNFTTKRRFKMVRCPAKCDVCQIIRLLCI